MVSGAMCRRFESFQARFSYRRFPAPYPVGSPLRRTSATALRNSSARSR